MKKIMLSLAVIAIVAVGAIGATRAYFSSTATMSGNTFTAGTMALKIDQNVIGGTQNWVDSFNTQSTTFRDQFTQEQWTAFLNKSALDMSNLYPGITKEQIMDIKNVGTVNGVATIKFDTTTWNALGDNLIFTVYYNSTSTSTDAGSFGNAVVTGTLGELNNHVYTLGNIDASKQGSVKIVWTVPTSANDTIQGLTIGLNTTFGLTQVH
jgi:predicted ribosomally synthesized peptide with SipW-like signal peptide